MVGLLTPAVSCLVTGLMMPKAVMLPFMMIELMGYGLFTGLFFQKFKLPTVLSLLARHARRPDAVFPFSGGSAASAATAAALRRIRLGAAAGAVVTGLPGIAVQVVVIPALLLALKKGGLLYER